MKKLKITFEENNKPKIKYKNYPRIDVNKMYSNSEDTIEQMQVEHIKKIKKKVLLRYLLPTDIVSVLLICGCATLSLYLNYRVAEISTNREAIAKRADDLAKEVRTLKEGKKTDLEDRLQNLIDTTKDKENYENNNQQNNDFNNTRLCSVPDCNYRANKGSYYCSIHECSQSGCHNQRANDLSSYCVDHKCIVSDCNNGRSLNSFYCLMHSN